MNLRVNESDMANEYVTVCNDECGEVSFEVVKQHVCRWMKNNKIVQHAVTHQAQNRKHCDAVMNEWTTQMKHQMSTYGIPPGNCEVSKTLSCKGVKTDSSACAANSGWLTVMSGVAMDGHKFPPYIISLK